jgi:translation initiation factor IF-1
MVLGINTVVGAVGGVVGKLLPGSRKEATLIDGKKIAATITAEVKADVDKIRAQTGKVRAQR